MSKELFWKIISSDYLFNDTWLKARKDVCIRPDGKIIDPYYVMEYPEWAAAFALTADNQIILVKQYRHAYGDVCLELPGGCVDNTDESIEAAIHRELIEETGYVFDCTDYLGKTSANPSTNSNCLHMFLLQGGRKIQPQQLDPNEEIEVLTIDFNQLKQLLEDNAILQSMHMTCIFYALKKLNRLHLL